jgi:hypothetical protein
MPRRIFTTATPSTESDQLLPRISGGGLGGVVPPETCAKDGEGRSLVLGTAAKKASRRCHHSFHAG